MSVFSKLYRYRFPFFIISIGLIAVLLLGDKSSYSQLVTVSLPDTEEKLVTEKPVKLSLAQNVNKTVLENGLTVITKEVHAAPIVTVQVWYQVGTRHEQPGVNGIAHQLEHMMFKGTKNRPVQFGQLFSALGSDSNAFTSHDQTVYYNTAERNKLKALLTLEADRMQNAQINPEQLASEKQVVISELLGYENDPEYRLDRAVMAKAFPHHAYGLPVGGTATDVKNFTVEQVEKYYRDFYRPDNAVLVIVGDIDTHKTMSAVQEIFGKIPSVRKLSKTSASQLPQIPRSPSPIVLREPGSTKLLQSVYPLPDANHPDVPALDVLDYILSEGRNSRLYKLLVDSGLTNEVTATVVSLQAGGWYELLVTANQKQDLAQISAMITDAIALIATKGVTKAELDRAKTQLEATVILENRDITSQAMQLGNDQTTVGDYRYTDAYLAAIGKVTVADVQRVAQKYLQPGNSTVGFFEPKSKVVKRDRPHDQKHSAKVVDNYTASNSTPQDIAKYLPPVDSTTTNTSHTLPDLLTLPNGLQVLLLPDRSNPTVTLSGYVKAGKEFDPQAKAGLAALVAENLVSGTKSKDVKKIANTLEKRGASLDFETYREGVYIQGNSLANDFPTLVKILADIVQNATFPNTEVELTRQQALTALKQELNDANDVAERTFSQSIYPQKHPAHTYATQDTLSKITRADIVNFHSKHYRPDTIVLALVGDFEPQTARSLIEQQFGAWQTRGEAPQLTYPQVSLPETVLRVNPVVPGKAQAVTYMGNTAISREDPRFYAAVVLNQILGGDTISSRLGSQIRDRLGLTYGIYSNFFAGQESGTFLIEMQTSPENTTRAIASTQKLLQEIRRSGVTPLEVETAQRTLISNYNISLASPEELAYKIVKNQVFGLETTELTAFSQKIQAVDVEQVNQAARELLHPDKIVVVTAGPAVLANKK